jgi:anaerobic selenocysteine-containing dehydrogenase
MASVAKVAFAQYDNFILTGGRDVQTVRSFCRICTAVCGIVVEVSGDQVVRVRGDQDHPFSHGYTCGKGRALPHLHHHADRHGALLGHPGEPASHDQHDDRRSGWRSRSD